MRAIFMGPFGLRSGWRASLWWLTYALVSLPVAILFFLLRPEGARDGAPPSPTGVIGEVSLFAILGSSAVMAVLCLPITALFTRFLDRRPLSAIGLAGPPRTACVQTAAGVLLGAGCIALCLVLLRVAGVASVIPLRPEPLAFAGAGVLLLLAASGEELAFRGYPFQWLARGMGFWPATILCALCFGLAHLANEGITLLSFAGICLASVLLSVARAVSRGLWLPIGLHFGWNATQGLVLGSPVSGIEGMPSLATIVLEGPVIWTGGGFGFEGSIGGLVAVLVGIAVLVPEACSGRVDWRLGLPDAPKNLVI